MGLAPLLAKNPPSNAKITLRIVRRIAPWPDQPLITEWGPNNPWAQRNGFNTKEVSWAKIG